MSFHTPQPGDIIAGKYKIARQLGAGGMGAVYAADHTLTGKRVAIKWMLPELATDAESVNRFLREAQASGRVQHPNVVDVYDVGAYDGGYYLVMELLRGQTLGDAMARRSLESRQLLQLMVPAMRGVAAAHDAGVIHRDVKPDNIFLCTDDAGSVRDIKILDFGISRLANTGDTVTSLTRTGTTVGTPHYMSPEQLNGAKDLDGRTDVYAFGVLLYESITGVKPFDAQTTAALAVAQATQEPRPPRELNPQVDPELEATILEALAHSVQDRVPSMETLIEGITPFVATGPIVLETQAAATPLPARTPATSAQPITASTNDAHRPPSIPAAVTPPPANGYSKRRRKGARWAVVAGGAIGGALLGLVGALWMQRAEPTGTDEVDKSALEQERIPPEAAARTATFDTTGPERAPAPPEAPTSPLPEAAAAREQQEERIAGESTILNSPDDETVRSEPNVRDKRATRARTRTRRGRRTPTAEEARAAGTDRKRRSHSARRTSREHARQKQRLASAMQDDGPTPTDATPSAEQKPEAERAEASSSSNPAAEPSSKTRHARTGDLIQNEF